jgi:hypothetical protein
MINRDFTRTGKKLLRVLPESCLTTVDSKVPHSRFKKNTLLFHLDLFLEKVKNKMPIKDKMVNTCFTGTTKSEFGKNQDAHIFLISVAKRLITKKFFKEIGVSVLITHTMSGLVFSHPDGKITFYYDKKFHCGLTPYSPKQSKSRLRA